MSERTKTIAEVSAVNMQSIDNVLVTAGGGIAKVSKANFVPAKAEAMSLTSLGEMSGKTIAQLKAAIKEYMDGHYGTTSVFYFSNASDTWPANFGDNSHTISAGGRWTCLVTASFANANYFSLLVNTYNVDTMYNIVYYNGTWTIKKIAMTDV